MNEVFENLPKGAYHWGRSHRMWEYCIYLGTIKHEGHYYDLGVYSHPVEGPSHATVYGKENDQYMSGDLEYFQKGYVRQETIRRWKKYLELIKGEDGGEE